MKTKTKRYKERSDLNNFKQEIKQHRNSAVLKESLYLYK